MKKSITIGQIDLSFHKATAAIFYQVLTYLGYRVEIITDTHTKLFALQEQDKLDLLMSAWLPGSHMKYLESYKGKVMMLQPVYEPYCVWGVPNYIPKDLIKSVGDLTKSDISEKMFKTINGIGSGAGISRFSLEIMSYYKLDQSGYNFLNNSEADFFHNIELLFELKKWFVIPLWYPQYLFRMFKIRPLEEPAGLLRGKDKAYPVLLKNTVNNLDPETLYILNNIYIGNKVLTTLDYHINKNNMSPMIVAEKWINKTYGNIDQFVEQLKK